MKRYILTLTDQERSELQRLLAGRKAWALKQAHARILWKADAASGGPAWSDSEIVEAVEVGTATFGRVRKRFVEQGLEATPVRKAQGRPSRLKTLAGRAEAKLIAPACSPPPEGRRSWTMQLLADKPVELEVLQPICDETVRRCLKRVQTVWLQRSRSRKPLKSREKATIRGIGPRPLVRGRGHYSGSDNQWTRKSG